MRQDGVSEVVGAFVLIAIAMLAMVIVVLIFFVNPLPTSVPSFNGLISNSSRTVYISHEGGDPLYRGQYKILVDNVDETWNFTKSLPDANRTFSHGVVMNATLPRAARRVVMVFNTSWGGGTVLLSADLIRQVIPPPYGWYDTEWLYRKKITIDHTDVPSDQSDFPVLISIADVDLSADAQTDGDDILFTASDGMTKLSHEIETYTWNSGTLVAWVKLPGLSSVTDTVIYMYYRSPDAPGQQDPASVWTNGYAGVWHLAEATGATRLDSTSNNNDLTQNNGPIATSTSGKIGNAADLVRTSAQYLYITDAAQTGLDITGPLTLEAWAKNDETANPPYTVLDKARGSTCGSGDPPYYLRLNGGDAGYVREDMVVTGACGADPTDPQGTMTSLTSGSWVYVAGVYDGSTGYIYKNAVQTDSESLSGPYDSNGAFYVGSQVNANYFDGLLDEVRVSSTARSANWLTTEYNNQNNPGVGGFLVSIGSEQTSTTMG